MIPLFLGLTMVNLIMLITTMMLGFAFTARTNAGNHHVLAGALSAIVCCGVHCVVFTYFIATAKWIQHAILVKKLDPQLFAPTRSFKVQAFPAALLAMVSVFAAAVAGAIVANYGIDRTWHLMLSMMAIAINILVALIELRAISNNGRLIDSILELINRQGEPATPATIV